MKWEEFFQELKREKEERARKFQKFLEERGWTIDLDSADELLELAEDFLERVEE